MQDRFVGDVGDFGKYGVLRALTGIHPEAKPRLSLGVVWYVPSGTVGLQTDGKHTSYLQRPDLYRGCDPDLFDRLEKITRTARKLGTVQGSDVLGNTTTFFGDPIPPDQTRREQWITRALDTVETNDIVFLDPDNGLAPPSASQTSPQHAYPSEAEGFVKRGQTVIIYHHLGRTLEGGGASHPEQMRYWAENLKSVLQLDRSPEILWFRRGTARAYFVLPARDHTTTIEKRLAEFRASVWATRKHFTALPPESPQPPT